MAMFKKEWVTVKVTGRVFSLITGRIKLNKKQAADRSHAVKRISGYVYEICQPVEFKNGETITVNREVLNKVVLGAVTPVDELAPNESDEKPGGLEIQDEPGSTTPVDPGDPTADGMLG